MRRAGGCRWRGAALVFVLSCAAAVGLPRAADAVRPEGRWQVSAVEVVPVAAVGQPLVAFVEARCEDCRSPLLQMRVCREDDSVCDVAARVGPRDAGVTRLRYARSLDAGRYRVEVLFLDRDALGASRSSLAAAGWVDVR